MDRLKTKLISISCTIEEYEYLKARMVSPTKLFKSAIQQYRKNLEVKNSKTFQLGKDIDFMQKHYNDSLKPNGSSKNYQNQVARFLIKYPNWTKSELLSRVENFNLLVTNDQNLVDGE